MSDGLDIGGTVTVLDEETLIVLEPIRSADYRVVQSIRVEILQRLANPLFEIRCRHNLQIFRQIQPHLRSLSCRRLRDELEMIDATRHSAADDDLHAPALGKGWKRTP